jgi:hypothetical protein
MDRSRHPRQSPTDHCDVMLFHGYLQTAQRYRALTAVAFIFAGRLVISKRLKDGVQLNLLVDS